MQDVDMRLQMTIDYNKVAGPAAIVLLSLAVLFGGQGVYPTFIESLPQIAGVVVIATVFAFAPAALAAAGNRFALAIVAALVIVPLLQLVPLPPSWWSALPMRGLAVDALAASGQAASSRPLTLDSGGTLSSIFKLLPAIAMMVVGVTLDRRALPPLMMVIVVCALLSMLVGFVQVGLGPGSVATFYPNQYAGLSTGLFSNRNHQGDLLVIGMLMAGGLQYQYAPRLDWVGRHRIILALVTVLVTGIGVLSTASRTGAAAFVPAALFVMASAFRDRGVRMASWWGLAVAGVVTLAAIVAAPALMRVIGRFGQLDDLRWAIWADSWYLAKQVFPWGTGMGTFTAVYQQVESLAGITDKLANAAHDDYLQVLIEAGLAALAVLAAFFYFLVRAGRRMMYARAGQTGWLAMAGIVLLLLHSAIEFPLRTEALSTILATLIVIVMAAGRGDDVATEDAKRYG